MAAASDEATAAQARAGLTLGHDRRWSFALADLSTGGKAQDRKDHCGSNGEFFHGAPNPTD
jgi:hypothetical protein